MKINLAFKKYIDILFIVKKTTVRNSFMSEKSRKIVQKRSSRIFIVFWRFLVGFLFNALKSITSFAMSLARLSTTHADPQERHSIGMKHKTAPNNDA